MMLTKVGDRYVAQTTYEERALPKSAGFRWDPDEKVWWTDRPIIAAALAQYADETCREELTALAAEMNHRLNASRATDAEIDLPVPEGLDYFGFQKAGIAFTLRTPNVLVADEMGLGKTIQAIGLINAVPEIAKVLVICPATLKVNWQREMQKWLVRPLQVVIASAQFLPPRDFADVVIVNYDVLYKHEAALRAEPWDLVIVDECHFVKNPKARRSQQVYGLPTKRNCWMTGTPIVNRPVELWPIIHHLDPQTWRSFWGYAKRYCGAYNSGFGWDLSGASNLEELQERLRSTIMVRRLKKDVLTDLPAKMRQVIELPANGLAGVVEEERQTWERHQDTVEALQAAVELAKASEDPEDYRRAVESLRAGAREAFTEISRVRHETALAKVPYVIEHLKAALEDGRKVVCFAHHHDVIDALTQEFGAQAVVITGETPQAERMVQVDAFQQNPEVRLFIGSLTAAGVGITLTASAHVVFAELDWVPGNMTQAEDRLHRIGQRESVLVQHLVLEGSLDATMARTLIEKQEIIEKALDVLPEEHEEPVIPGNDKVRTRRSDLEAEAARLTTEIIKGVHVALRILAVFDPDYAAMLNGVGFNRYDGRIGHDLAARETLTPKQAALGRRLVLKYHRQLPENLNDLLWSVPKDVPTS